MEMTRGSRTDMSRPGIEPGHPTWEASTLEKSHPDSLLIAIQNIYIWARDRTFKTKTSIVWPFFPYKLIFFKFATFSRVLGTWRVKNWLRPLFRPGTDNAFHQKPNPSRDTVPLHLKRWSLKSKAQFTLLHHVLYRTSARKKSSGYISVTGLQWTEKLELYFSYSKIRLLVKFGKKYWYIFKISISICNYGSVVECIRYPEVPGWCPTYVLVFFRHGAHLIYICGVFYTLYVISV